MELEIRPENKFTFGFKELWQHRELFYFFTLRDIRVKYKQTVLGVLWAVLQPVLLMVLFSFFLGKAISSYASLDLPYDIFALSGLVLWGIFSTGLNSAGNSMVSNANIIRKVYFPRLIIPLSSVFVALFDFLVAFAVFLVYCALKHQPLDLSALYLFPLAILLASLTTFGAGCLLAALNVKYRDFRYVIPFLIQLLLFLSPVIYPVAIASSNSLRGILNLNPLTAPLEMMRAGISGAELSAATILPSVSAAVLVFVGGLYYFRRSEAWFADLA